MMKLLAKCSYNYAKFDLKESNEDELCLKTGEILISNNENIGGWAYGFTLKKFGWFPVDYVDPIDDNFFKQKFPNSNISSQYEEGYNTVVNSIIEKERQYIAEFKDKYQKVSSDLLSKTISSKLDTMLFIQKFEAFIKIYDDYILDLIKEHNKAFSKQSIGKIFLKHFSNIYKLVLHYCQLHPYFINHILIHRNELEVAFNNKLLSSSIVSTTKFLSMIFMRPGFYCLSLVELLNNIDASSAIYIHIRMAICSFELLCAGCTDIRKSYSFLIEIYPHLENYLADGSNKDDNPLESIVYHTRVFTHLVDENEDQHYLVFHVKKLFHIRREGTSAPNYTIMDVFNVPDTTMEEAPNTDSCFNNINILSSNNNKSTKFSTSSHDELCHILDIWNTLKQSKMYYPFWVTETETSGLKIPRLAITCHKDSSNTPKRKTFIHEDPENKLDYEALKNHLEKLEPRHSSDGTGYLDKANSKLVESEILNRINKLESTVDDILKKLRQEYDKQKYLEEVIINLAKLIKKNGENST